VERKRKEVSRRFGGGLEGEEAKEETTSTEKKDEGRTK